MRDQHYWTPRRFLAACLLVSLAAGLVAFAIVCSHDNASPDREESRYETEYAEEWGAARIWVLTDKKTGKRFMFVRAGYAGGLTEITKDRGEE